MDEPKAVCVRSMQLMVDGTRKQFDEVVHPDAINREGKDEPPECRGRGPAAFYATALWLRGWFSDLAFEIHEVVAEGDMVVVHNTMSGRQTGVATMYGRDGGIAQAMPATGKPFATTQTHWFRMRDGLVIEHWANRDDQGTAMQLGWIPPSPWCLVKMALATRRAKRREATRPATSDGLTKHCRHTLVLLSYRWTGCHGPADRRTGPLLLGLPRS